jgi:hypothetical protein
MGSPPPQKKKGKKRRKSESQTGLADLYFLLDINIGLRPENFNGNLSRNL